MLESSPTDRPHQSPDVPTLAEAASLTDAAALPGGPGSGAPAGATERPTPRRTLWLAAVDAAALIALSGLLLTGLLMFFVLPPGSHGASWLGGGRHEWGDVHAWLSATFLVLMGAHLVLHAGWIATCWRRYLGGLRSPATWAFGALLASAVVLPFAIPVEHGPDAGFGPGSGEGRRGARLGDAERRATDEQPADRALTDDAARTPTDEGARAHGDDSPHGRASGLAEHGDRRGCRHDARRGGGRPGGREPGRERPRGGSSW